MLKRLEQTGTAPTLRLAVRFMLLTAVRKGEFIGATWTEVDWERAQWSIPGERMKAGKPHTVYLAEQALDILTTLRTCFPSSKYVHPSRYDSAEPLSQATLNRTIAAAVGRIVEDRKPNQEPFLPVSVHDLRRTFSSRLNDALFPEALIEACLAHQKEGPGRGGLQPCTPGGTGTGAHASVGGHARLLVAWRIRSGGHRRGQGEDRRSGARCRRHEPVGREQAGGRAHAADCAMGGDVWTRRQRGLNECAAKQFVKVVVVQTISQWHGLQAVSAGPNRPTARRLIRSGGRRTRFREGRSAAFVRHPVCCCME